MLQARYTYLGPTKTVDGLQVDWAAHKITRYPPGATETERFNLDAELVRPVGVYTGQREAYRRLAFGRILDYYRGTPPRVLFLRLRRRRGASRGSGFGGSPSYYGGPRPRFLFLLSPRVPVGPPFPPNAGSRVVR